MKGPKYIFLTVVGLLGCLVAFLPTPWVIALGERGLLDNDNFAYFTLVSTFSFMAGLPLMVYFCVRFPSKVWKRVVLTSISLLAYLLQVAIIGFFVLMVGVGQMQTMD